MSGNDTFQVHALIFGGLDSFLESKNYLEQEESINGTKARLQVNVQRVEKSGSLLRLLADSVARPQSTPVILISDKLVTRSKDGSWRASPLAQKVRELFMRNPAHLCGLIAALDAPPHRITDIDAVMSKDDVKSETLKTKVLVVATRMWLKSPVTALSDLANRDAILVRHVQSEAELHACFELRHRVYDALGYLEEPVSRSACGIDIDSFDTKAVHFAALDGRSHEVVGTARLVTTLPPLVGQTVIGDPWRVFRDHGDWTKAIARHALLKNDHVFHEKITQSTDLPFPILFNSDFGTQYRIFMEEHPPALGGEISRVVVSPSHRGFGVSALLMRAVISTAFQLRKRFLLLECVPAHARMYEKYGFRVIRGHHCRAQDLDQVAVGMSLSLEDHLFNKTVAIAKTDGQMLGKSGVLCLCCNTECWRRREFEYWQHEGRCPLAQTDLGHPLQAKAG